MWNYQTKITFIYTSEFYIKPCIVLIMTTNDIQEKSVTSEINLKLIISEQRYYNIPIFCTL